MSLVYFYIIKIIWIRYSTLDIDISIYKTPCIEYNIFNLEYYLSNI